MSGAKTTRMTLKFGVVFLALALLVSLGAPAWAQTKAPDDYARCHGLLIIPEGASLFSLSVKADRLISDDGVSDNGLLDHRVEKTYSGDVQGNQWYLTVPPGDYRITLKWVIRLNSDLPQISPERLSTFEGEETVGPLALRAGDDIGFTHKIARRVEMVKPGKLLLTAPSAVVSGKEFVVKVTSQDGGNPIQGAKIYLLARGGFVPQNDLKPLASTGAEKLAPGALWTKAALVTASKNQVAPILPTPIPKPIPRPIPIRPVLLGETNEKGELACTISSPGRHLLRAQKEGFVPAVSVILVEKGPSVRFFTDKPIYQKGEEVLLVLYNGTDQSLTLTNTAPWKILNPKGEVVFAPMAAQVIMTLNPGETRTWVWSQKDSSSKPVPSGSYVAKIMVSGQEYEARFNIVSLRWKGVPVPKPSMPAQSPFKDVTGAVEWADPYIAALYQRGVVKGKGDGLFAPDHTLSRAEFLALLMRSLKLAGGEFPGEEALEDQPSSGKISRTDPHENTAEVPFADVPPGHWARSYVAAALRLGLVEKDEYPGGFWPDAPIARQEMAVLAVRAMGLDSEVQLETQEKAKEALPFKDVDEIEPDWRAYVKMAVEWGILNGYEDNTFRPQGHVTRGEAAVVIFRLMGSE